MKPETHLYLDQAAETLQQAQSLNDTGNPPAAIKQAFDASNQIAVAYMYEIDGRALPVNDNTYYLFSKIVQEPNKHLQFRDKITSVVRTVFVLHEAYEPALLSETTKKDAQQMIGHVSELLEAIPSILAQNFKGKAGA